MKRIIYLFIALFLALCTFAQDIYDRLDNSTIIYVDSPNNYYKKPKKTTFKYPAFCVDALYGQINKQGNCKQINEVTGFGMTTGIIYIDGIFKPRSHEGNTELCQWYDNYGWTLHIGPKIKFLKYMAIIPLIGYGVTSKGITDGSNWHVGTNGIYNEYYENERHSGFDYGMQLAAYIPLDRYDDYHIKLSGTYTKFSKYIGIGFSIKFYPFI